MWASFLKLFAFRRERATFDCEIGVVNHEIRRWERLSFVYMSIEDHPLMVRSTVGMRINIVRTSSVGIVSMCFCISAGKWRYLIVKSGLLIMRFKDGSIMV